MQAVVLDAPVALHLRAVPRLAAGAQNDVTVMSIYVMGRALALVLLVLFCLGASGDGTPVEWVRPHAFVGPDDLVAWQVRIEPRKENRLAVFSAVDQADGLEVRRSQEELDGANAPRTRWLRWRLPRGRLTLTARVYGVQGVILGLASTPVWVRGRFDEPEDEEP